ncbi:hypothetical protein AURDEDRAFT_131019 [Auricularia subglabra TFB-10046 SS5]|nr:hypothetical protein AURDEDRAFT_131019 [Auricularia subglabra TFB-10046 SS5]
MPSCALVCAGAGLTAKDKQYGLAVHGRTIQANSTGTFSATINKLKGDRRGIGLGVLGGYSTQPRLAAQLRIAEVEGQNGGPNMPSSSPPAPGQAGSEGPGCSVTVTAFLA